MNLVFSSPLDRGCSIYCKVGRRGWRDHLVRGPVAGRGLSAVRARLLLREPGLRHVRGPTTTMSLCVARSLLLLCRPARVCC
jgi:hypothetical protein